MKIPPRTLDAFIRSPRADVYAILVYGPDEGLVRERMNTLTKTVVADIHDPFNVVEITAEALGDTPSRLLDEAQSLSMLGGRRVIRLRGATDKTAGAVRSAVEALKSGDNLVLVEADNLTPRSALRLLFEEHAHAAAIPCYVDDERSIARILSDGLKEQGYNIASDALVYMAANVVGDRGVARGEIEKLVTYMGPEQKRITLEDVEACVGAGATLPLDDLSQHIAYGRFAEADRVLDFLLSEGSSAVMILRSLIRHYQRLHQTKYRLSRGADMDSALRKLRPPVFFKYKNAFETQAAQLSLRHIEQVLHILCSAESRCKQTGSAPDIITSRAVMTLCQISSRSAQRRRA